jgi:ureidoacrylate peracid hydrolase
MLDTKSSPGVRMRTTPVKVHRPMLRALAEKVKPQHCALVIIDVLNDFCAPGGMVSREGGDLTLVQNMVPRLKRLIDAARAAGAFVVFVRNVYSTDENWYLSDVWIEQASRRRNGEVFTKWDGCPPNSWQNDFYDPIRPLPSEPIVVKHRYNAFYQTDLDLLLRGHGIRTIITTGISTNICVETTAREGFIRDYYIVFPSDGTACYSEQSHAATLRVIGSHFGEVVTVDQIIDTWKEGYVEAKGNDAALTRI